MVEQVLHIGDVGEELEVRIGQLHALRPEFNGTGAPTVAPVAPTDPRWYVDLSTNPNTLYRWDHIANMWLDVTGPTADPATLATAGLVELGDAGELSTGVIFGGSGAPLVVTPDALHNLPAFTGGINSATDSLHFYDADTSSMFRITVADVLATQPFASTTDNGVVELTTAVELRDNSNVGGTGAPLVVTPDAIATVDVFAGALDAAADALYMQDDDTGQFHRVNIQDVLDLVGNASFTARGHTEIAAEVELRDGTLNGGSGAPLAMNPFIMHTLAISGAPLDPLVDTFWYINGATGQMQRVLLEDILNEVPFATDTVAGRVEVATQAETNTGAVASTSGAPLVVTPETLDARQATTVLAGLNELTTPAELRDNTNPTRSVTNDAVHNLPIFTGAVDRNADYLYFRDESTGQVMRVLVDDVLPPDVPNATTNIGGITELATAADLQTDNNAGGSGASTVVTPDALHTLNVFTGAVDPAADHLFFRDDSTGEMFRVLIDDILPAGVGNATTNISGISELTTAADLQTNNNAGGSGASTVVTPDALHTLNVFTGAVDAAADHVFFRDDSTGQMFRILVEDIQAPAPPNASVNVNGTVEMTLVDELRLNTNIGGTGAALAVTPQALHTLPVFTGAVDELADTLYMRDASSGQMLRVLIDDILPAPVANAATATNGTCELVTAAELRDNTNVGGTGAPTVTTPNAMHTLAVIGAGVPLDFAADHLYMRDNSTGLMHRVPMERVIAREDPWDGTPAGWVSTLAVAGNLAVTTSPAFPAGPTADGYWRFDIHDAHDDTWAAAGGDVEVSGGMGHYFGIGKPGATIDRTTTATAPTNASCINLSWVDLTR